MKRAFTLAEVLITLTIIGVIAALTIPNLMRKYDDHVQVTAFKKNYSIIQNAFKMAIAENGPIEEWEWPKTSAPYETTCGDFLGEKLKPYLKIAKYCGSSNDCIQYKANRYLSPTGAQLYFSQSWIGGKMILSDGAAVGFRFQNTTQLTTHIASDNWLIIDTNGSLKGPNKLGYDIFEVSYNKNGLTQYGTYWGRGSDSCNPTVVKPEAIYDGAGCTYWVLKHGNMDYKYRDVSAEW